MRVYFSHSIRGKLGAACPLDQQVENCETAIGMANEIRRSCPEFELYVPAEHEDFVQKAYDKKYLTEKQILDIDCDIIDECDNIIIFVPAGDELQGGRLIEHDHAINECMHVCVFKEAREAIDWLKELYNYDCHHGVEPKNRR